MDDIEGVLQRHATAALGGGAGAGGGAARPGGGKLPASERFGNQLPFAEPAWYQGFHSPYYNASHKAFRAKVRDFVEKELKPHCDEWIASPTGYPKELHEKAYAAGINGAIFPAEYGGTPPEGFDAFHELILWDELSRVGGGAILAQLSINSMALPPILNFGSDYLKNLVARDVVTGKKNICLAISEPLAGSDVANIQTSAEKTGDGWVVNGTKKWITGGAMGDFFTTLVRTGGPDSGPAGLSLLLLERGMKGIEIRKMPTQFDSAHSTTMISLHNVHVPARNLIGEEGAGFMYILHNFNAMQRRTFGKRLVEHQIIRGKLAEMARLVEALQDNVERVAYQFAMGVADSKLGGQCALLKVNGSRVMEFCAREASQIFGGSSVVREGRGKLVERLYREVRAAAIPGGSEEILLDFAMRQVATQAKRSKL